MGWNDHFDFDLDDAIEELVDDGALEKGSAAYGVAQQAIYQGYNSLSRKQRYVFDKQIIPLLEDDDEDDGSDL